MKPGDGSVAQNGDAKEGFAYARSESTWCLILIVVGMVRKQAFGAWLCHEGHMLRMEGMAS